MKILTNITHYYYPIGAKLHYNGIVLTVEAQEDNRPSCLGCYFSDAEQEKRHKKTACYRHGMSCTAFTRKDKQHVIFSESV